MPMDWQQEDSISLVTFLLFTGASNPLIRPATSGLVGAKDIMVSYGMSESTQDFTDIGFPIRIGVCLR
jgi:hypothetical protein